MRKIVLNILVSLMSFSFLSFANSEDLSFVNNEEQISNETELNFFTGMFDFSDNKQASGFLGLQHQNDDSDEPIKHPLIEEIFTGKKGSGYFKPSN